MKEPVKPVQYSEVMQQYHMYGGETVASMLAALGDQIDYTKCIFNIEHGYYDDVDYMISYPVEKKIPDAIFERQMVAYNKKLIAYNEWKEKQKK